MCWKPDEFDAYDNDQLRSQNKILWERVQALDALLVCYRVGKRPSEKLLCRINRSEIDMKKIEGCGPRPL